jgi:hypothetical protein
MHPDSSASMSAGREGPRPSVRGGIKQKSEDKNDEATYSFYFILLLLLLQKDQGTKQKIK